MEFDLTPEQLSLQKAAIDFARAELSSDMIERDAERIFSHDGWKKCAAFGVHGLPIPEEFGGSGSDPITTIAIMEGLGYGSPDQGLLFSINAHMWTNSIPLLKYGTDEQKQKYLARLMRRQSHRSQWRQRAKRRVGCFLDAHSRHKKRRRLYSERHENFCYQRSGRRFVRSLRHP